MNLMRMMLTIVCLLASVSLQGKAQECIVEIKVIDYYGKTQDYKLEWFRNEDNQDYTSRFKGLRGILPCDYRTYRFQVSRTDIDHQLGKIQEAITVAQRMTWKTILINPNVRLRGKGAGELTMSLPADYVWRGRLIGGRKRPEWVHIRSAFGALHTEAAVGESGEFQVFSGFVAGLYLLYAVDGGGEILHTSVLDIKTTGPRSPITIELDSSSPSVRVVR